MWISVADDGIYKVDINTFQVERVFNPVAQAFMHVREFYSNDGDVYAIDDTPTRQDSLWRLRQGQWTKIIPVFDLHSYSLSPRSWLPVKDGLLAQSYANGLWYIPKQGEPAQLTWRSGFPIEQAHSLCQMPDGTIFAIGHNDQIFHGPLTLPPHDQDNARVVELDTDRQWTIDVSGHLWIVPKTLPLSIQMWDGTTWISHPLPVDGINRQMPTLVGDKEGRLWLLGRPLDIFDTRSGQWQSFPKLTDAYRALRNAPPHFLPNDAFMFDPQYAADGKRIATREGAALFEYYDGSAWQNLQRYQITGQRNDNAVGPPWFDQNGKLCVNLRNKMTWQMEVSSRTISGVKGVTGIRGSRRRTDV
jgi:hypothetical protein